MKSLSDLITILDRFSKQVTENYLSTKIILRFLAIFIFIKFLEAYGIEDNQLTPERIMILKQSGEKFPVTSLTKSTLSQISNKYSLGQIFSVSSLFNSLETESILEDLIRDFQFKEFESLELSSFCTVTAWLMNTFTSSPNEKKQKGQFFTPPQISQAIVNEVVSTILDSYHGDIRHLKFIDPACGTGSFLVALYSCLNKEYQKRLNSDFNYNPINDPLENIYGIDISEDATFLSSLALILYQNVLNKNSQEADSENSSKSILFSKKLQIFTGDALFLDWSEIFPTKPRFFTAVVGNPPFVQYLNLEDTYRRELTTADFQFQFQRWDLYILFIEKSLMYLKKKGFLAFIVPDSFLNEQYAKYLRCYLTENFQIKKVIDLRRHKVFLEASVGTLVLQLVKSPPSNNVVLIGEPQVNYHSNKPIIFDYFTTSQNYLKKLGEYKWRLIPSEYWEFFEEINNKSFPLYEICYITNGFQISPISSFETNESETVDGVSSRAFLRGEQIQSYYISSNQHSWFLYSNDKNFYLKLKRPFSSDPKSWKPKFPELFENPKIVIPRVAGNSIRASFDNKGYYCWQTIVCILPKHYITDVPKKRLGRSSPSLTEEQIAKSVYYDPRYLLGIINSKLTHFYFTTFLGNGLDILKSNIEKFRIPSATEHDQREVISTVKNLELLNQKLNENSQDIDIYQTQKNIVEFQKELDNKILTLFNISTPPWKKY